MAECAVWKRILGEEGCKVFRILEVGGRGLQCGTSDGIIERLSEQNVENIIIQTSTCFVE